MLSNEFLLALLIGCLLQESWSRSVSITLNLNLDLGKNERTKISGDMVQKCLVKTEVTMNELIRFRLGLIGSNSSPADTTASDEETILATAEADDPENKENYVDYSNVSPVVISERYQEPIQCFAHCLYEEMGLIKDGVFMENEIQRMLFAVMEKEQVPLPECMDLDSENKCEAAYKLHLCYSKLKMLAYESHAKVIGEHMLRKDEMFKNATDELYAAADGESEENEQENEIPNF